MRLLIAIVVFIVFLALSATAVKNDPVDVDAAKDKIKVFFSADKFDAEGYVNNIWDATVLPHIKEKAVPLPDLMAAIKSGDASFGDKHGYRAVAEQNPYNYAVKGRVKILSVVIKRKDGRTANNGRAEADIEPFDGKADVILQLGPVFTGTSIRDLLPFVSFDDFTNQVEFAKLATQLNHTARATAIEPSGIAEDGGEGEVYEFYGATTPGGGKLSIVPVILTPAKE